MQIGASFDVASIAEFRLVYENIKHLPAEARQDFIWDKIIYSNPIKDRRTLEELDPYKPLVTYDNLEEIRKIRKHAPHAGLALRIRVPNTGSMVELSSKFGASPAEAVDLIAAAFDAGLVVEGLSFHVGQPVHQLRKLRPGAVDFGLHHGGGGSARVFAEAARHRRRIPGALRPACAGRSGNWRGSSASELNRLFPKSYGNSGRARAVHGRDGGDAGGGSHRQVGTRRQTLLLHQ